LFITGWEAHNLVSSIEIKIKPYMKRLFFYLLLPIAFTGIGVAHAQVPAKTYVITGTVIDSASQKPADYVTVALKKGEKALKSTLTDQRGAFRLLSPDSGKYQLNFVQVGYGRKSLSVTLREAQSSVDIGQVLIAAQSKQLNTVQITGERPIIRQEIDRIAYDLQADPESKASSVLDMMKKVPMLSVDAEENILLKGQAGYKILINGKPSSMVERDPKNILKSMPASTIERIEVITTPPAKYDAEGLTGIINIVTNKKIDAGYNGSVNMNGRFPAGGPGFGGSLNVKGRKLGASVYLGGSTFDTPPTFSLADRQGTYLRDRQSEPGLDPVQPERKHVRWLQQSIFAADKKQFGRPAIPPDERQPL
jgi:ferric enterobactin receptor